ncbi:hypothetical protein QE152_g20840 [Popillia japonica]|uniref:Uncharacterized protein n=1 Tax=Popillia japonica TaxID=7064 RepID=A0AAW1KNJ0_POPJA
MKTGLLSMLENELRIEDVDSYKNFLRMCVPHFDELLNNITNNISKQDTVMRQAVCASHRLALTLRFLATGQTYRSLMYSTRIHESTISIIPEVCEAIINVMKNKYLKMPSSVDEWLAVANKFEASWNFPFCLGSMDGRQHSSDVRQLRGGPSGQLPGLPSTRGLQGSPGQSQRGFLKQATPKTQYQKGPSESLHTSPTPTRKLKTY